MSSELLSAIKDFFKLSWKFFTQTQVPGTNFSMAVLVVGCLLVAVSFSFLSLVLGFSVGSVGSNTEAYKSMGRKIDKISNERRNDTR